MTTLLSLVPRRLRDRIVRARMRMDDRALEGVELRVADSVGDLEAAARLVHDAYVGRGIAAPHPSGLRVTPHFVVPSTVTLMATRRDKVVGTMSIVVDGPLGPPMAKIFGAEIALLRSQGRRIAEIGALSLALAHRKTGLSALLYRMAIDISIHVLAMDDLVFAVHPDAEDVYRSAFLSERLGETLRYPGLNASALAVPIRVDLRRMEARMRHAFAALPRDTTNPHYVYFERHFPQIRMPRGAGFVERARTSRMWAAAKLLATCPEALDDLSAAEMAALQAALPDVALSAPHRTSHVRELAPTPYRAAMASQ